MEKILLIEDEAALQSALSGALGDAGYEVVSALDGEIGLERAKKESPSLILLDLILPKKDGFEVLRELKADPGTAGIPTIILSNLERSADVEQAIAHGATTYLVKTNYNLGEIVAKVREILGEK
jgi:DNA-binding response OmpR family regulator